MRKHELWRQPGGHLRAAHRAAESPVGTARPGLRRQAARAEGAAVTDSGHSQRRSLRFSGAWSPWLNRDQKNDRVWCPFTRLAHCLFEGGVRCPSEAYRPERVRRLGGAWRYSPPLDCAAAAESWRANARARSKNATMRRQRRSVSRPTPKTRVPKSLAGRAWPTSTSGTTIGLLKSPLAPARSSTRAPPS